VADRRERIDFQHAVEREAPPRTFARLPVQGRLPSLTTRRAPSLGEPQLRPPISTVGDELGELPAGHWTRCDGEGLEEHAVPRTFIVEREGLLRVRCRALRRVPDQAHAALALHPLGDRCDGCSGQGRGRLDKRRPQRVARKPVQDVGQQQLLMLLLVMQAELDQREHLR
jgi:hypothetical protein